jgi:hypothetical protein
MARGVKVEGLTGYGNTDRFACQREGEKYEFKRICESRISQCNDGDRIMERHQSIE